MSQHPRPTGTASLRSNHYRFVALILGIFLLMVLLGRAPVLAGPHGASAPAAAWRLATVASGGDVGTETDIAVDTAGAPHITFFDKTAKAYHYTTRDGAGWTGTLLDTIAFSEDDDVDTALALDGQGHPHISYSFNSPFALLYVYWDGSQWQSEEPLDWVSVAATSLQLALRADGLPCISFTSYDDPYSIPGTYLQYVCKTTSGWSDPSWEVEIVTNSLAGIGELQHGFAVDDAGEKVFVYPRETRSGGVTVPWLRYATTLEEDSAPPYKFETIDELGGLYPSLALDSSRTPHASYYDLATTSLNYARRTGSDTWVVEVVDDAADVGLYSSIALDAANQPHIAYYDTTNGDLKYAAWDGARWQVQVVDSPGNVGQYAALALDAAGAPHISYYDATNGDLKYATLGEGQPPSGAHIVFLPYTRK
jgi:hypothetical protein